EGRRAGRGAEPEQARGHEQSGEDVDRVAVERGAEDDGSAAAPGEVDGGDRVREARHAGEQQPADLDAGDAVMRAEAGAGALHPDARDDDDDDRGGGGREVGGAGAAGME